MAIRDGIVRFNTVVFARLRYFVATKKLFLATSQVFVATFSIRHTFRQKTTTYQLKYEKLILGSDTMNSCPFFSSRPTRKVFGFPGMVISTNSGVSLFLSNLNST
jgi:hypothetical protein